MSEKQLRFTMESDKLYSCIFDNGNELTCFELVDLLNEQQATITKLEQICEKKMQEIEDIKYSLKEIAYKYRKEVQFKADTDPNQAVKEVLDEQQDTIRRLQDLCGESDSENAKLRIENKMLEKEVKLLKPTNIEQYEQIVQLQKENEQLRKELGDCEKFRYQVFKRMNEEYIKECSIR